MELTYCTQTERLLREIFAVRNEASLEQREEAEDLANNRFNLPTSTVGSRDETNPRRAEIGE